LLTAATAFIVVCLYMTIQPIAAKPTSHELKESEELDLEELDSEELDLEKLEAECKYFCHELHKDCTEGCRVEGLRYGVDVWTKCNSLCAVDKQQCISECSFECDCSGDEPNEDEQPPTA
ncbi:hypothetical protein LSAT2_013746, partial [Lamellibrachia satsuma]